MEIPFRITHINKPTNKKKSKEIKFNTESLGEASTRYLYRNRLDQKLQIQVLAESTDKLYDHITLAMREAALEALGERPKPPKKNTGISWNPELEHQKTTKQEAYTRWLTTKNINDKIVYKHEQARFKRMIWENKNATWEKKCSEVNTYIGGAKPRAAWKFIKTLRSNTSDRTNIHPIQLERFKEHFKNELTETRTSYMEQPSAALETTGQYSEVTEDRVWKAVKTMKTGKASGPEGLPAELFKHGTTKLISFLTELIARLVNGEDIPQAWRETWITPIYKKGKKDECTNYRCIAVTNTMSRIYGKVLKQLIEEEYAPYELEQQAGFRTGRSCVDHIFTITQLHEKRVATNRESHLLFVDLSKAYDTIPLNRLWQVLEGTRINITIIKAIQQLYRDQRAKIKLKDQLSESFPVNKGLRQGCCLSPTLFNIYIDKALKEWRRSCEGMGIELNDDITLYTLHFADDQVVLAQDKEDLELMTRKLLKEYETWGLIVNQEKTKYLCVGKEETSVLQIEDHIQIGPCTEYTYLGTKITSNGRTEPEIEHRIVQGKKVIGCLNSILWGKHISKQNKKLLYNTILRSIVLYGSEAWQMSQTTQRKLRVLEMDYWRRSAGKSRRDKVPNKTILEIMEVEEDIIQGIERKQLEWYGHVERMSDERLPKLIKNWSPREKRKRGRPKTTWIEGIERSMSARNLSHGDWENREDWRKGTKRRATL